MKPGDWVVCVRTKEERTDPICTPLVVGRRYRVLAVRDAGLAPPADPLAPHEVKVVPGPTEVDRLGWWFQSCYFTQ